MDRNRAYVDTSAFIAFRDRSDTYHPLFAQLFSNPPPLVTTSLVVAEAHGWFLRRYDTSRALELLDLVDKISPLRVLPIGEDEIRASAGTLRRFSDQDLTLADACGLWLMNKLKVRACWSTDRHLSLTGVPLVIHEIP